MAARAADSSPKADLLQGTLDMLILQTLAAEPLHGYAIARRLRQLSEDALQVPQGSLYPALHRLERRKWLKAAWRETQTGRSAKFYSLTPAGRRQLGQEQTDWERFTSAIARVMRVGRRETS